MPSPRPVRKAATPTTDAAHNAQASAAASGAVRPLGIYDTNSVRARIDKWQIINNAEAPAFESQGAGIVDRSGPTLAKPKASRAARESRSNQAQSEHPPHHPSGDFSRRRKAKDAEVDVKTPVTPKRRLVSDGHWKLGKESHAKAALSPEKEHKANTKSLTPKSARSAYDPDNQMVKELRVQDRSTALRKTSPSKKENWDPKTQFTAPDSPASSSYSPAEVEEAQAMPAPLGTLNAKNLRGIGAPPNVLRPAERDKGNDYHPALEYFAGRPISDPPLQLPKQQSPPKKPTDLRPTLQFFAGRPPPRNLANSNEPRKEPTKASVTKEPDPDGLHVAQSGSPPPPMGRIEAWLGASTDPFVDRKPENGVNTPRVKAVAGDADPPFRTRDSQADEERQRRRERRRALRKDRESEQAQQPHHSSDQAPESPRTPMNNTGSEGLANNSLKRSGAKRQNGSPQNRTQSRDCSHVDLGGADRSWKSYASDLASIAPDDSASMLFMRPTLSRPSPVFNSEVHDLNLAADSREHPASLFNMPTAERQGDDIVAKHDIGSSVGSEKNIPKRTSTKRRKLTSQADLITVLSEAAPAQGALVSACSVRPSRSKTGQAPVSELLTEIKRDEDKYMRELRTLVDGVIPVLLTKALSDDEPKPERERPFLAQKDKTPAATAPIVNMGVALERLRSVHKRMPFDNADALLFWAPQAHRVYADYINAWRLGFQDVVVNLAPGEEPDDLQSTREDDADNPLAFTVASNQKADVAYLLKRPLVRVKHLSKAFKGLSLLTRSAAAIEWADRYHGLVEAARRRQSEEKARLEDEAAACIDVTRTRDPRTLAPLSGVRIDPTKCVRARDFFNLQLHHSNGQCIDCQVELILRDDPDNETLGDILVCEVNTTSKWLFLPPIKLNCVSARAGERPTEIVALLRSSEYSRVSWQELVSMNANDGRTASDWIGMLGSRPLPPKIERRPTPPLEESVQEGESRTLALPPPNGNDQTSTREVLLPFGEQASVVSHKWESPPPSRRSRTPDEVLPLAPGSSHRLTAMPLAKPDFFGSAQSTRPSHPAPSRIARRPASGTDQSPSTIISTPFSVTQNNRSPLSTELSAASEVNREKPNDRADGDYDRMRRFAKREELSEIGTQAHDVSRSTASPNISSRRVHSVWLPSTKRDDRALAHGTYDSIVSHHPVGRTVLSSRSGQASSDIASPQISRSPSQQRPASRDELPDVDLDQSGSLSQSSPTVRDSSLQRRSYKQVPTTPTREPLNTATELGTESLPRNDSDEKSSPAPRTSPAQSPLFTPGHSTNRRPSSPLKHEYEPSTTSNDSDDAGVLTENDDDAASISSISSTEDIVPSLPAIDIFQRKRRAPDSLYMPKNPATVAPSQSASQVHSREGFTRANGAERKIALIFCWSDKGAWEQLHLDECSIVVSPGLIEAYEMSAAHSSLTKSEFAPESSPYFSRRPEGISPLIGLELTPLVPLRRGTAIDISIRSPLTKESSLKLGSNNIMFRSRNNVECEHLYNAINQARINNPTYMALQNARPSPESNWAAYMDARPTVRPSWWRLGRKRSYRAGSSRRTPSVAAQTHETESSVATMSSALSALRRFTSGSKMFNVAKSTVTHGSGILSSSLATRSMSSGGTPNSDRTGSGTSTPPAGVGAGLDPAVGAPLGINGAKVRLYSREMAGKWRDMGSARLTIMQPPRPAGAPPPLTPDGRLKQERRLIVQGGGKGNVLLDVTLGESAFERVARTGIALSVWERAESIEKRGSVMGVRVKVYMLQMKSEAEAAYTFSLVGRMRY